MQAIKNIYRTTRQKEIAFGFAQESAHSKSSILKFMLTITGALLSATAISSVLSDNRYMQYGNIVLLGLQNALTFFNVRSSYEKNSELYSAVVKKYSILALEIQHVYTAHDKREMLKSLDDFKDKLEKCASDDPYIDMSYYERATKQLISNKDLLKQAGIETIVTPEETKENTIDDSHRGSVSASQPSTPGTGVGYQESVLNTSRPSLSTKNQGGQPTQPQPRVEFIQRPSGTLEVDNLTSVRSIV